MLDVRSFPGLPNARFDASKYEAIALAAFLVEQSASFYIEPLPFDRFSVVVAPEHKPYVARTLANLRKD